MNSFEARLLAGLGENSAGKFYLAAVSGGADSTAMLSALASLREKAGFVLRCVHVEHGLRPAEESRGDAREVEMFCETLQTPCRVISFPPGKIAAFAARRGTGIEAAARFFRHRAFRAEARRAGADRVLTAHTRDDALETVLMRVLRGSGPAGLAVMPRTRGILLRPLLDLTRAEVLAYLTEKNLPYRVDSTNNDIAFLRNKIRLRLVPLLDESFPGWKKALLALAETQTLAARFIADEAAKHLAWQGRAEDAGETALRLREEDFFRAPQLLREEAVFSALDSLGEKQGARGGQKTPRRAVVRRAVREASPRDLGPARLERENGFVVLKKKSRGEKGFSLLIKETGVYTLKAGVFCGKRLTLRVGVLSGGSRAEGSTFFTASLPLVLREYRHGDRVVRGGRNRRLSDMIKGREISADGGVITACDARGPAAFIATAGSGEPKTAGRDKARSGEHVVTVEVETASKLE